LARQPEIKVVLAFSESSLLGFDQASSSPK
jgi:hypothetical protein